MPTFENLNQCLFKYNSQRKTFIIVLSIFIICILLLICGGSALTTIAGLVGYEIKKKDDTN